MNCKTGDVARYIGHVSSLRGMYFLVGEKTNFLGEDAWYVDPPPPPSPDYVAIGMIFDKSLKPINDQPGNESWFTAAPKSLPATTKGDTITERGELA